MIKHNQEKKNLDRYKVLKRGRKIRKKDGLINLRYTYRPTMYGVIVTPITEELRKHLIIGRFCRNVGKCK